LDINLLYCMFTSLKSVKENNKEQICERSSGSFMVVKEGCKGGNKLVTETG